MTQGWLARLRQGLQKSRRGFVEKIERAFASGRGLDEEFFEEIEELLIAGDVGVTAATGLVEELRLHARGAGVRDRRELREILKNKLVEMLDDGETGLELAPGTLNVVLFVGVNGVGKTTTIAKVARVLMEGGHRVLLAAADTFRAAAIDQLEEWGRRAGAQVIRHQEGSDPAAVVYDGIKAGLARGCTALLVDTAGRLHTKRNLMEELKKIARVAAREVAGAPHEVLLVLDATTGQNALQQARLFKDAVGVTGAVLTKLDGTAKGGIAVAVRAQTGIPVKYVGVGEGMDDLREFSAREFVDALFERG